MKWHFKSWILYLVFVVAVGVAACQPAAAPTPTPNPKDDISIQFGWVHTIEYAGFYIAQEDGDYADANLNVTLVSGGFDDSGNYIDPVERVMSGQSELGIINAERLLTERASGKPLVAVATIYQRSPLGFVSLAESNIVRPQDLIGKTIAIDLSGTVGPAYLALLASQGIDPADVNQVPRTDVSNEPLISGQVDVIDAFITNQPVQLELAGYDINTILISDYGLDTYANVIFTTEDTLANRADLVERFLGATFKGIESVIEAPERGSQLSTTYNASLDAAVEAESMLRSIPLLNPAGSHPGMMLADVWETTRQILLDQGILTGDVDLEKAYTLDLLNKIYGN
jgi:NitT/TauT family transport system substrate-binding protein